MKSAGEGGLMQNFISQDVELVEPVDNKLWEGDIEGKRVTYFRSKENNKFKSVVVVTQDNLPDNFRSVEYCDSDGDWNLDLIKIKMYSESQGWKDIKITNGSVNTLNHAKSEYNNLLEQIVDKRLKQIDF
jgi:hypothetical protein